MIRTVYYRLIGWLDNLYHTCKLSNHREPPWVCKEWERLNGDWY